MPNPRNTPLTPRKSLIGKINTYKDKDPILWQILRDLAQLENDTFNDVTQLQTSIIWDCRIKIDISSPGINLAEYWPRVYIPRDSNGNQVFQSMRLKVVGISADPVPSTDLIMDVQYSRDNGVNFTSIFNSSTTLTLPMNNQTIQYGTNTVGTFYDKDIFQVNCSDNGGSEFVEIYLSGFFVPIPPVKSTNPNL